MHAQSYVNTPGYLFILIGVVLSTISALVPHFEAGYTLMTSVLVTGMLPYLVYGIAVPLLRGALTSLAGLVIIVAHAWLVFDQRIIGIADYSNNLIYYVPMVMALAVLPLAVIALKKT